jgi:hypothetical protein
MIYLNFNTFEFSECLSKYNKWKSRLIRKKNIFSFD